MKLSYFDHMSSCSDLDLEESKSIFWHGTLTHNDASQYQVWKQNGGGLEDICTNSSILALHCDFDPECSNPIIFMMLWPPMMYNQTKFGCQGINSSDYIVERVIF